MYLAILLQLFRDAIAAAVKYKKHPTDWQDQVLSELEQTTIADTQPKPKPQELIDDETHNANDHESSQEKATL